MAPAKLETRHVVIGAVFFSFLIFCIGSGQSAIVFCSFVLFSIEPTGFRVVLKPKSLCLPDVFAQAQCGLYGRIDIGAGSRIECYGPVS